MNSYNKKVIFHLPGAFRFTQVIASILQNFKMHPETFKDNIEIGSVYGSPGNCIWNGGRLILGSNFSKEELEMIRDTINGFDVPVRFTFTNLLIEEKHLNDAYCNIVLEVFGNGKNEIICNSEILENYIRSEYGDNYKYISSTTKRLSNKEEQLKELEKDYHLIVLDYDYNKDFEFLKSISNKEKCEILCNPICVANCKARKEHYLQISQGQLNFDNRTSLFCKYAKVDSLWGAMQQKNFISADDINDYLEMGFSNFKLEGRTMTVPNYIDVIIHYLIKDEYQLAVREQLFNQFCK